MTDLPTLQDAIDAHELDQSHCGGHMRRGVWKHICANCQNAKPAFALLDVRSLDPFLGFIGGDCCYASFQRQIWSRTTG